MSNCKNGTCFSKKCSKGNDNIYLVTGQSEGNYAWYFVKVDRTKEPIFLYQCKKQSLQFDLNSCSAILDSGWGENPPQEVAAKYEG